MGLGKFQTVGYGYDRDMTGSTGATHTIEQGQLVNLSVAGYAKVAASAAGSVERFLGIAADYQQNSGSAGAKDVRVWSGGIVQLNTTGTVAATDIGKYVYVHNGDKVALSGALTLGTIAVGTLLAIPSTGKADVWLNLPSLVTLG